MALSHCFCAAAFVGFEKSGIFISLRRFTFMESRKKDRFYMKWYCGTYIYFRNDEIYEKLRMMRYMRNSGWPKGSEIFGI